MKVYEGKFSPRLLLFFCSDFTGQFRYPSVQRYLHDLVSEIGEHIEAITSSLSVFIEIGLFQIFCFVFFTPVEPSTFKYRRPNHPVCTRARCRKPPQFVDRGDILLCRHRDNFAVHLRYSWHSAPRCSQCLLVYLDGLQHRRRRQQSLGVDMETGHVV